MMAVDSALQTSMAKGWLTALERAMPADGHFDTSVLASAGPLPIVEQPVIGDGLTPEDRARREVLNRVGARAYFKAFTSRTLLTKPAEMRQRRRELEQAGADGEELERARAAERYWSAITEWLEEFEP